MVKYNIKDAAFLLLFFLGNLGLWWDSWHGFDSINSIFEWLIEDMTRKIKVLIWFYYVLMPKLIMWKP